MREKAKNLCDLLRPLRPLRFKLLQLCVGLTACTGGEVSRDEAPQGDGKLFTMMPAGYTGIGFANRLHETNERNVFTYRNYYNGGGVALGDLNGDGLPEVLLTSNEEGPRLYLNRGSFRFRDITRAAGLESGEDHWTTGVTLADVNADGLMDIYISRAGPLPPEQRANALWINQGIGDDSTPEFRDMAKQYGVADQGYSTHAAFLDYDRDGDLDLYVMNNSPRAVTSFGSANSREVRHEFGGDRLYRNDGSTFTDVSVAAGIYGPEMAFGLGIAVSDLNRDGWPDIYIANDFFERDYLYLNNRDGTFKEVLSRQFAAVSYYSMGLDIGDVNNDGWPDVYTTDMLPEDEYRLKTTTTYEQWGVYEEKVRNGYHRQLSRNMLQRNNGDGTFSDVGHLAGVARTDWTWSALIADLDLDGQKDIYVTNGMARDITSQDYLAFLANDETMRAMTSGIRGPMTTGGGGRERTAGRGGRARVDFMRLIGAMKTTPIPNYAFHNAARNGLRFESRAADWGLATPSISSGSAYGDLDGDGALDLVVNNVNQDAFVYRNNARALMPDNHYVRVRLEGSAPNTYSLGARVTVYAGGDTIVQEQAPARGFQSSVDYVLNFGLGQRERADSIRIDWPDGRVSRRDTVVADQLIVFRHGESAPASPGLERAKATLLVDATAGTRIPFEHSENAFLDFDRERMIPKLLSIEGPPLAVADVNGDGLDDAFIGGAKGQPGALLLQNASGDFAATSASAFSEDAISEDVGAAFFDANGDGWPDLYVVSGGNEYSTGAPALQDRLYMNDGSGRFRKSKGLPQETHSGSRVAPADYDGDGDVDVFVGGRVVPWRYGMTPESMLLRNDGSGRFTNVTEAVAPGLADVGMVTDAVWADVDGDDRKDLIVAGEWMPISVFRNAGAGRLARMEARGLEKSHGWWSRIVAGDFNGDGRIDFAVGNLGLNSRLSASESRPLTMHAKDFDRNGVVEQILSIHNGRGSYPMAMRDELIAAVPSLRNRFSTYEDYALKTVSDILTVQELEGAIVSQAYTLASSLVINQGNATFSVVSLPLEAQLAPVYGMVVGDFDRDRRPDLLIAGNFEGFKPETGPLNASYGLLLKGDGKGGFTPIESRDSGFLVTGQVRDMARLRSRAGPLYLVARNNERPLVFRPRTR